MLGVTFLGLVFTPLFYTLVRGLVDRRAQRPVEKPVVIPDDIQPINTWRPQLTVEREGGTHA
jgi:hypothetical protein